MRTISPNLVGIPEVVIAEEQHEYKTMIGGAAVSSEDNMPIMICRWRLTPAERQKLIDGEDLWTTHLTFGHPFQPLTTDIGKPDWLPPLAV
jgi:UDP-N-acetyl-D-mannosaminuronic acid transferase (WecB/TagA/CpsF family)